MTEVPVPAPRPRRRVARYLLAFAALAGVAAALLPLRGGGHPASAPTSTTPGAASRWRTIELGKAVAGAPRWTDPIAARVAIDETRTARVGSPLDGRITAVKVERGAHVAAGTPLFTVASPSLAELRHDRDRAVVEVAAARAALDRTQALVATQFAPGKDLLDAQQQLDEAEIAAKVAQSKLAALKISAAGDGAFTVVSPRDGVVVERDVYLGQQVTAEAGGLVVIADLSQVWVVSDLFDQDAAGLRAGAEARVSVDGARELPGVVDQVSAVIDPDKHTIPVRVRLDNHDGTLRPHSFARVRFLEDSPAPVEVPASAVLSDGDTSYVYVPRAGGGFEKRVVVAGTSLEGEVPIYQGLAVGDAVVVKGAVLLDNQLDPAVTP